MIIATVAARQFGVVSRRQLLASGLSDDAVDRRIGTILLPVHAGVYAAGHRKLTTEGRWLAATLACGDRAALSHRAATALWGLRPAWRGYREVSAPRSVKAVRGVILHRPRTLERTIHERIPVTPLGRTIVDLADVVSARTLRQVLEQTEVLRLEICREAGLPKPRANATIDGMEVDFCWPERRLVVEIDSWKYHGGRTAHRRDRRRSTALLLGRWTVVRFTDEDVELDRDYVVGTLAAAG